MPSPIFPDFLGSRDSTRSALYELFRRSQKIRDVTCRRRESAMRMFRRVSICVLNELRQGTCCGLVFVLTFILCKSKKSWVGYTLGGGDKKKHPETHGRRTTTQICTRFWRVGISRSNCHIIRGSFVSPLIVEVSASSSDTAIG